MHAELQKICTLPTLKMIINSFKQIILYGLHAVMFNDGKYDHDCIWTTEKTAQSIYCLDLLSTQFTTAMKLDYDKVPCKFYILACFLMPHVTMNGDILPVKKYYIKDVWKVNSQHDLTLCSGLSTRLT